MARAAAPISTQGVRTPHGLSALLAMSTKAATLMAIHAATTPAPRRRAPPGRAARAVRDHASAASSRAGRPLTAAPRAPAVTTAISDPTAARTCEAVPLPAIEPEIPTR